MIYRHILPILAMMMLAVATGCKDESWHHEGPEKKYGTLSFQSMDFEISGMEQQEEGSRSEGADNFVVEISDATGVVDRYSYTALPDKVELEVGDYSVKVRTSEVYKAAWEKPYYEGLQNVTIAENSTTEVEKVVCRLSNIKVSIAIAEDLRKLMANDCKVLVIANDEGELEFTLDDIDNGKAGYFEYTNSSKTLVATLTGTVDGKQLSLQAIYNDLEPGQHRIIYYSLKPVDPEGPDKPGTDPDNPGTDPGTDPDDPDNPGTDPDNPDNPGTDPDNPDNPDNPGTDPDEPTTDPEDPTTGRIEISNGIYIDVTVKTVDLNMSYPGEYYDPITGIIRPGDDDPDYTPPTPKPEDPQRPPVDLTDNGEGPVEPDDPNPPIGPVDPVDPDEPDEPDGPDEPTPPASSIAFDSETLSFDSPNSTNVSPALVVITSEYGITSLRVKIDSSNGNFIASAGELLPLDFDLANPGAYGNDFKSLGFPVGDEVTGATTLNFDITQFVPLLDAFEGTHTFLLEVTDEKGYKESRTLTIIK